jgi:hypothetical protein
MASCEESASDYRLGEPHAIESPMPMTSGHKRQKTHGFVAMSQGGNALDISRVWPLNGHQLPARTSEGGRFPDEPFQSATHLPCDGRSCVVRFRKFAVRCPSHFFAVRVSEGWRLLCLGKQVANASGAKSGLATRAGPVQSEEECCKKSISTSFVVAVTVCREWF